MRKLNFGCGLIIKEGFENVDIQEGKGIDKSFDFNKFPYPYKDNIFDYVLVDRILEFLDNPYDVLKELHRITKSGGIIESHLTYYNCRGSANDIRLRHRFNDQTFISMLRPQEHYQLRDEPKLFEIEENELIPTRLGKLIYPKKLRWLIGCCMGEIYNQVYVRLKVVKYV